LGYVLGIVSQKHLVTLMGIFNLDVRQGDQMSLLKIAQNVTRPIFRYKNTTFTVEKVTQKFYFAN
jgi:hypothetical protein